MRIKAGWRYRAVIHGEGELKESSLNRLARMFGARAETPR